MNESNADVPELAKIKARFSDLQANVYSLLSEFICWHDVLRYPDIPTDSEHPARLAAVLRNGTNEWQIRYLFSAKEKSIILDLWDLLYDEGEYSDPNLQHLVKKLNDPREFPNRKQSQALTECRRYVDSSDLRNRFDLHRNNFLAHIASLEPATANSIKIVEYGYIHRLVPKTIHLIELLHSELAGYPSHFTNQFKGIAQEVARRFSHSEPDQLLADLFESRSLPADQYDAAADWFFFRYGQREKAAR